MKHLLYLFLACSITLVSCGGDDDTTEDNENQIIGTWLFASFTINGDADPDPNGCDALQTLQITGSQITRTDFFGEDCDEVETETFAYTIDGDQVTITFNDNESLTSTIVTLNSSSLVLRDTEDGDVFISSYTKQ